MAHKKAGGSTSNVRDSQSQRLGVKAFGGERVQTGDIIVRQRGTHYVAGQNVFVAKDHTLHAHATGSVAFRYIKKLGYDGNLHPRTRVSVEPDAPQKTQAAKKAR